MMPGLCQIPDCGNPKMPGQGGKLCEEHRDNAYRRKLEGLRRTKCQVMECPEPKLFGRGYKYCAKHSAEGPERESRQVVRRKREREYGITQDQFLVLLERQRGVCAICGNSEDSRDSRSLSVDHDHVTGTVRGLLCNRCNPMLGYARDNVTVLQSAITYLTTYSAQVGYNAEYDSQRSMCS